MSAPADDLSVSGGRERLLYFATRHCASVGATGRSGSRLANGMMRKLTFGAVRSPTSVDRRKPVVPLTLVAWLHWPRTRQSRINARTSANLAVGYRLASAAMDQSPATQQQMALNGSSPGSVGGTRPVASVRAVRSRRW